MTTAWRRGPHWPRVGAMAFVLAVGVAFAALADDFVKECRTGNPGPDGEKACSCLSDKMSGPDRVAAIDAMNKTNAAMAKGDTSMLTPEVLKTMATVMTLQAACT
jgi:hypothetical protein